MDYDDRPSVVYERLPQTHEKPRVVIQPMPTSSFTTQNIPAIIQDLYDTWNSGAGNSQSVAVYKIKNFPQQVLTRRDVFLEVARHGKAFQKFYMQAINGELEDPGYTTGVQMLESIHNKLCKLESLCTARD